jgi:hypothetical protein
MNETHRKFEGIRSLGNLSRNDQIDFLLRLVEEAVEMMVDDEVDQKIVWGWLDARMRGK